MLMKPPFIPQLTSDTDSSHFDNIEAEQEMDKATDFKPSKATDKTHFWGYTFKRPIDMSAPSLDKFMNDVDQNGNNSKGKYKGKPLPSKPLPQNKYKPKYSNK